MTNGIVLNILNDEETKDAKSFNEQVEDHEILIVTKRDI
jgi:hypothetical protein